MLIKHTLINSEETLTNMIDTPSGDKKDVIFYCCSLPEKLFYAVVHRTPKMPIFTGPAKFLVVLMKKFRSF